MSVARGLTLCALALAAVVCSRSPARTIPDELVGVWTTNETRYRDRFLELQKDHLIIGAGEAGAQRHPILGVESDLKDARTLFRIHYLGDEGERATLAFFLLPNGVLQLKNQTQVSWTRERR